VERLRVQEKGEEKKLEADGFFKIIKEGSSRVQLRVKGGKQFRKSGSFYGWQGAFPGTT